MSEFPNICSHQIGYRSFGIFVHTALLKCLPWSKIYTIFRLISLILCWSIKTFCDAAHSHFTIQQKHKQFCILDQLFNGMVRFLIGTLLQLLQKCNYLWPQNDVNYIDYPRDTTFTGLTWRRLCFTVSFILIGLTVASGKVVTGILS